MLRHGAAKLLENAIKIKDNIEIKRVAYALTELIFENIQSEGLLGEY